MKPIIEIVNSLDPRCTILELAGYSLVAESWGAHLNILDTFDLDPYIQRVEKLNLKGFQIQELSVDFATQVFELELATNIDYPQTPATEHLMPTLSSILELWTTDTWIFGASSDSELVGVISASQKNNEVNLDFASVKAERRGNGIGSALASMAIVSLYENGIRNFSTGGAAINVASLATVKTLNFKVDEIWRSYSKL